MEVNIRNLAGAGDELKHCATRINRALGEIERIRHQLRELSNVDEFTWILRKNEQKLSSTADSIHSMASVLDRACEQYERTENRICDKNPMSDRRYYEAINFGWRPQRNFWLLRQLPAIRGSRPMLDLIYKLR